MWNKKYDQVCLNYQELSQRKSKQKVVVCAQFDLTCIWVGFFPKYFPLHVADKYNANPEMKVAHPPRRKT